MIPSIQVDPGSKTPLYKQLMRQFENAIHGGSLSAGELLPSMNDLSASTGISKETVKKTYGLLREKRLIVPKQGKKNRSSSRRSRSVFSRSIQERVRVSFVPSRDRK